MFKKRGRRTALKTWLVEVDSLFRKEVASLDQFKEVSDKKFEFIRHTNDLWDKNWEEAKIVFERVPGLLDAQIGCLKSLREDVEDEEKFLRILLKTEDEHGFSQQMLKNEHKELKRIRAGKEKAGADASEWLKESFELQEKESSRIYPLLKAAKGMDSADGYLLENLKGQKKIFSKKNGWAFLCDKKVRAELVTALEAERSQLVRLTDILEISARDLKFLLEHDRNALAAERITFNDAVEVSAERADKYSHQPNDFIIFINGVSGCLFSIDKAYTSTLQVDVKISTALLGVAEEKRHDTRGGYGFTFNKPIEVQRDGGADAAVFKMAFRPKDLGKFLRLKDDVKVTMTIRTDNQVKEKTYDLGNLLQAKTDMNKLRKSSELFYDDLLLVRAFEFKYLEKERLTKNKVIYASPRRDTIHFTLNHYVKTHGMGDWEEMDSVLMFPLSRAPAMNEKNFYGGLAVDVFFVGFVRVPADEAVFVKRIVGESFDCFHKRVTDTIYSLGYPVSEGGAHGDALIDDVWFRFCKEHGLTVHQHTFTEFGRIGRGGSVSNVRLEQSPDEYSKAKVALAEFLKNEGVSVTDITEESLGQAVKKIGTMRLYQYMEWLDLKIGRPDIYKKYKVCLDAWMSYWTKKNKKGEVDFDKGCLPESLDADHQYDVEALEHYFLKAPPQSKKKDGRVISGSDQYRL
ncbi:MAG: hypothetical protein V1729_04880 [Candidatus Woesearchaeota archaeon]